MTKIAILLALSLSPAFATCSKLIDTAGADVYHCPDTGDPYDNGADLRTFLLSKPYACGDTIILYAGVIYRANEPRTDPMWPIVRQANCNGKMTTITSSAASEIPFGQKERLINYRSKMPLLEVNAAPAFGIDGGPEPLMPTNNYKFVGLRVQSAQYSHDNRLLVPSPFIGAGFNFSTDALITALAPRNLELDRCIIEQYEEEAFGDPNATNTNGDAFVRNVATSLGGTFPFYGLYVHDSYIKNVGHNNAPGSNATDWISFTTATAANPSVLQATGLATSLGITHDAACDAVTPACNLFDSSTCLGHCARVVIRGATGNWLPLNGKKYVRARADGNVDVIVPDPNRGYVGNITYFDGSSLGAFSGSSPAVSRVDISAQYGFFTNVGYDIRLIDNYIEAWGMPIFFGGSDGPKIDPATIQEGSTETALILSHVRDLKVGMGLVFSVPVGSGKSDYCTTSSFGCWATDVFRAGRVTAINGNTVSLEPWGVDGLDGTAPEAGDNWLTISTATAANPAVIQGSGLHAALAIGNSTACDNVSPPCANFMTGGTCGGSCARVNVRGATGSWVGLNGEKYVRARADGNLDVFNPDTLFSAGTATNFDASGLGAFSGSTPQLAKLNFAWWKNHVVKGVELRGNALSRGNLNPASSDAGKGVMEVKQCENCLIDGNVMGGYLNSSNVPVSNVGGTYFVTARSQGGGAPNAITSNVRFSNNLGSGQLPDGNPSCLWQTESFMVDSEHSLMNGDNLHYEHNVHVGCVAPSGPLKHIRTFGSRNSSVKHNTYAPGMAQANSYNMLLQDDCTTAYPWLPEMYRSENFIVRDNIIGYGDGISVLGGATCLTNYPGGITKNVVVDTESVGTSAINTEIPNNFPVADYTGMFVGTCAYDSWTNCKMHASYTHKGAASDGGDPGADIEQVQDRMQRWGEQAGLIESDLATTSMKLRQGTWQIGSTKVAMMFTLSASTAAACTVQIFTNANRSTAHADTSSAVACNRSGSVVTGNVVNFVAGTASALTASTTYYYRITDGSRVMVGSFTTRASGSDQTRAWSKAMECGTDGSTFGTAVSADTPYTVSANSVRYCRQAAGERIYVQVSP